MDPRLRTPPLTSARLFPYAGGVFIRWDETPRWWVWLQELALYTQATRAMLISVFSHAADFGCGGQVINGQCLFPLGDGAFACDGSGAACTVSGREALRAFKGVSMRYARASC